MNLSMRWVAIVVVAVMAALPGCRKDEELSKVASALGKCDDPAACAKAVGVLRSLDRSRRDSEEGIDARLLALRVLIAALATFPEPDRAFLEGAGLEPDRTQALLEEEARAIEGLGPRGAGVADARTILNLLRQPSCERLMALDPLEAAAGPFTDVAYMAHLGALARMVGQVQAMRVQTYADFARTLLGCRLRPDIDDAEVMLTARVKLDEVASKCPRGAGALPQVKASCQKAAELVDTALPLPLPGLASGELAGAMLPPGRGYGLSFTPPWILVLTAGRLLILDQPVLPPGARTIERPVPVTLVDLRQDHGPQNLRFAISDAREHRPDVEFHGSKWFPLAVDRTATYSDLMEVLEAMLAESDATPALALLPPGARTPFFLPLNYRFSSRPLIDMWGARKLFVKDPPALDLFLSPFTLAIRAAGVDKTVDVITIPAEGGPPRQDFRAAYLAAAGAVGDGPARSARLTAAPSAYVGLLAGVLEGLSLRVSPGRLNSSSSFATAAYLRDRDGLPEALVPLIVIRAPEVPPE